MSLLLDHAVFEPEVDDVEDNEIEADQIEDSIEDTSKPSFESRKLRKAKRPSAKFNQTKSLGSTETDALSVAINSSRLPAKLSKNSRRPRGRFGRGLTKKGGAGGKGTWGSLACEWSNGVEEGVEDPHDPNYDSDSQENCELDIITPPLTKEEIEKHVTPIINEYFEHGDTEEVIQSLMEINFGDNPSTVLVIVVSLAMEKKSSHREMASVLISDLYSTILSEREIEAGFDELLKLLPDLVLDTPDAATLLGNFIARAIADDCIAPKFVQSYPSNSDDCKLVRIAIDHANTLLNMKHGLVRLDTVWGLTGGMRPVKYLVKNIVIIIEEYCSSLDIDEAIRCLSELEVPHFHHEFVYEAVLFALEKMSDETIEHICTLLKSLTLATVITVDQLKNGFNRVYEAMPDIVLDVPKAYQILEKLVNKASDMNFIPVELVKNLPARARKRFVSEGDGGQIKD